MTPLVTAMSYVTAHTLHPPITLLSPTQHQMAPTSASQADPDITSNEYLGRSVGKLQVLELEWSVRGELALPLQTKMGG